MQPTNVPSWNTRRPRRRGVPLLLISAFALVAVATVLFTLLFGGGKLPWASKSASIPAGVTPAPLAHVPTKPPSSYPPIHSNISFAANATPCPVQTATPASHVVLSGTPVIHLSPTPTPTIPRGGLPVCASGQRPGAHCVPPPNTFPGAEPTQDEKRQAMYNLVTSNGFDNFSMVEAVAWQESGWTEDVLACDGSGGIGLMQVQPDTAAWLNQTDGTTFSPYTLDGNVHLGVALLSWMYAYYIPYCNQGMPTGQTCDWDTVWPGATDGATVRQIVISSYNQGVGTTAQYGIQNWNYVNNVMTLRQQFLAAEG